MEIFFLVFDVRLFNRVCNLVWFFLSGVDLFEVSIAERSFA